MASVQLKRIKEAYCTLKFWMAYQFNEKLIDLKIKDLKDGDWIRLDNANPKENILEDSMITNQLKTNGTDISFFFACLISIKLEVISEMNTRLRDRESLLNAMMNEDEEVMNEMKKKYPEMSGTYVFNFNKIILEGMDKKSFEAELAKQIDHLKCYIFKCYTNDPGNGLHSRFVEDVLEFDKEYTNDVIDSHLNKNISYHTKEFASLRSVWSYFRQEFEEKSKKYEADLIKSILEELSKELNVTFPTPIRLFPFE